MTLELLQSRLHAYYADQPAAGENLRITEFTQLNSSAASDVYAFTLQYDQVGQTVGQKLILKTYNDTSDGKDRALKERHALFNLRADRYPVPGVAAVEIDPIHLGQPFVVMEQVDGQSLWDAIEAADGDERRELVRLFASLMVDLHKKGATVLVRNLKPSSEYLLINREIYTMRELVNQQQQEALTPVLDWLHAQRVPATDPVITHRDFHPSNVLLTEQGRPFVIDWVWQIADARYDLAWTLTGLERNQHQALRDEVLAAYESINGGAVDALAYFEVVAHTRWLIDTLNTLENTPKGQDQTEYRALVSAALRYTVDVIAQRTGITLPVDRWLL